jgi:hypothetical protein
MKAVNRRVDGPYNEFLNLINEKFSYNFDEVYKSSNKRHRTKLLPFVPSIYRRWYYSAWIEDTFVTPSVLLETLNNECSIPSGQVPLISLRTPKNYTGFTYSTKEYTLENHPVAADLRAFIEFCRPDINLTKDDQLSERAAEQAAKNLHTAYDRHYVAYLLNIAVTMNLIVKMPSIHTNRAQVIKGIEKRLDIPDAELFKQIVTATVRLAAFSINEMLPLG